MEKQNDPSLPLSNGEITVKERLIDSLFNDFWGLYPSRNGKRIGKEETFKKWSELTQEEMLLCIDATKNYSNSEMVKNGVGIKDPIRFLWDGKNKKWFWREWIEPEKEKSRYGIQD